MKNLENLLHTASKKVSLRDSDKTAIRAQLLSLEQKPISPKPTLSPFLNVYTFTWKHSASLAFVALFFFSGGLSALADKSLPGSFLYPLKTDINEQVLAWFAVTPESKQELSIKLAQRRIEEAELIADEPSVSLQVKKDHLKTTFAQVTIATENDDKTDDQVEAETETEVMVASAPAAPEATTMMMKVATPEAAQLKEVTSSQVGVSVSVMSVTEKTPAEEIIELRKIIKTLSATLVEQESEGGESRKEEVIKIQAKLLIAQKKLLLASDPKISLEKRAEYLIQVNTLVKNTQEFLNTDSSRSSVHSDQVATSSAPQLPETEQIKILSPKIPTGDSSEDATLLHN